MHRLDTFPGEELIQSYRRIFSSKEGPEVLTHMLFELGAFTETSSNPEDVALKNYGLRLLKILGGGEIHADTIELIAKKLVKQPLERKRNE